MTAEELLERYASEEKDSSGVDLSGVGLIEVFLEGFVIALPLLTRVQRSLG